jgi:hypothetical protein
VTNSAASITLGRGACPKIRVRVVVARAPISILHGRMTAAAPDAKPVAPEVAGELWLLCVAARPLGIRRSTKAKPAKLGLCEDAAMALGRQNVAASLAPLSSVVHALPQNGIGHITGDITTRAGFCCTTTGSQRHWQNKLSGSLVVTARAPDMLVYGEGRDRIALDAIATFVRAATRKVQPPVSPTCAPECLAVWKQ